MLYWQGLACEALGRHEQAVFHLAQAEGRGMRSADLFYSLAQARYMAGDPAAAELAVQRVLEMQPTHPEATAGRVDSTVASSRQSTAVTGCADCSTSEQDGLPSPP